MSLVIQIWAPFMQRIYSMYQWAFDPTSGKGIERFFSIEYQITRTERTVVTNQNERRHPLDKSKHQAYVCSSKCRHVTYNSVFSFLGSND